MIENQEEIFRKSIGSQQWKLEIDIERKRKNDGFQQITYLGKSFFKRNTRKSLDVNLNICFKKISLS